MDPCMEVDEPDESTVREEKSLTEYASFQHHSTNSACLDFFIRLYETPILWPYAGVSDFLEKQINIVDLLKKSWDEDPLISLKLIFHLRSIRRRKQSFVEFHHCLIWLFHNHPKTFLHNLEYVPSYGYWKDLSCIVKFMLEERVSMTKERQKPSRPSNMRSEEEGVNYSLEEIIKKRVDGLIPRKMWETYLQKLPEDEERKNAKLKFQELSKAVHLERSRIAKLKKQSCKAASALKLLDFQTNLRNFSAVYEKVVHLFVSALKRDKESLDEKKSLPMNALAGKWSPTIDGSIDFTTALGKNIARELYSMAHQRKESDSEFDKKAFIFYRKEFLTPLRTAIEIPEQSMSKKKWEAIDFHRVPLVCMERNKEIMFFNSEEKFEEFLGDITYGEPKKSFGTLFPHQIVMQIIRESQGILGERKETIRDWQWERYAEVEGEMQWKIWVDKLRKSGLFESCLSVCDVSGSMPGTQMLEFAIALSLLTAELSNPPFNSQICSFSSNPALHKIDQPTLAERVATVRRMDRNLEYVVNVQAVFDLVLALAIRNKLPSTEMVKTLFFFTEMPFKECGGPEYYETDYQIVKTKFELAGYPLPAIVFWNLRGDGKRSTRPVSRDDKNVTFINGFSEQMLKTFLEGGEFDTPYSAMLKTLGTNYDILKVID